MKKNQPPPSYWSIMSTIEKITMTICVGVILFIIYVLFTQ